jgi:serine-aspartate repeat-containing protein C/D/E
MHWQRLTNHHAERATDTDTDADTDTDTDTDADTDTDTGTEQAIHRQTV